MASIIVARCGDGRAVPVGRTTSVRMIKVSRFLVFIVAVVGVLGISLWLAFNIRAKPKYDEVRSSLELDQPFAVVEMNEETVNLFDEVHSSWDAQYSVVDGPHTDALNTLGLTPSVSNVISLYTYQLPEYSWLSPEQNKAALRFAAVYAVILPATMDQSIHVSPDRQSALIRRSPSLVDVFTDESDGLREASFFVLPDDQATSPNNAQLQSSAPSDRLDL